MTLMNLITGDERGVSEVVGYVLLVGLVLTSSGIAIVIGSQAIGGLQAESDAVAARPVLEELDAELTSVAASSDASSTTFDFSGVAGRTAGVSGPGGNTGGSQTVGEQLSVQRDGSFNVTVFAVDGTRCSAESDLGTVRFEEDSRVVAYEGGGIWERSPSGGSAMVTAPDVSFREGSLDVSLVNITGHMNSGETTVTFNQTATRLKNAAHENELANCASVDRVEITVNSTFADAWGEYLAEQTGATANEIADDSVRLELTSTELPRRVDMERNRVVNVSNPPYMTAGAATGYTEGTGPRSITVDKDAGNSYLVSVESLTERRPRISEIRSFDQGNVTNFTRDPIDVAFVIDESGSMNYGSNPATCSEYGGYTQACPDDENGDGNYSDPGERIYGAQQAAKAAVATMNTSVIGDRGTVVGYNLDSRQRYPGGSYFTASPTELNTTFNDLYAAGGTNFADALNRSIDALQYRDEDREAHILLLTDGEHDVPSSRCYEYFGYPSCDAEWDDRARNAARIADSRGYTVHTFAYGADAENATLQDIASITGGQFNYSADGDELEEVFADLLGNLSSEQDYVARTPLSTNFTDDQEVNPPQIVGDTDPIANDDVGGQTFLNINDPTSPTLFAHSFSVDDGDEVVINATKFECVEWADVGSSVEVDGRTLPLARCQRMDGTNESLEDSRIEIYKNGDDMTPLLTNDAINDTLNQYDTTGNDEFDNLASNQVVVNLNFEATPEFENNLVLLYEIGLSEADVRGSDIVNLQESTVRLD